MRAIQLYGAEDVRIENLADLAISDPRWPNRVLLEVEWCGLCGSDLHCFSHGWLIFSCLLFLHRFFLISNRHAN